MIMTYTENDITVEMWKDEARTKENGKEYNRNLSHKKAITALQQADKSTRLDKEKYYYSQEHVCDIEHTSRNISEEEYWRRANALTEKRIKELYGNEKG